MTSNLKEVVLNKMMLDFEDSQLPMRIAEVERDTGLAKETCAFGNADTNSLNQNVTNWENGCIRLPRWNNSE